MSIEFICQVCGRELKADERAIGRKVRCPDCATLLVIPDPAAVEEEEQPGDNERIDRAATEHVTDQHSQSPRGPQSEEDISTTAPMDLEQLQALEPLPDAPQPPPSPPTKRRREKSKQQPVHVEPPPETAPPVADLPPPPPAIGGAVPPRKPHTVYDDAPLLPPPRSHPEDLIDMTAMVDIVFFLLIFFLVTSLQSLESVMNLPTPQSGEPGVSTGKSVAELENDPNFITVRIEDDDSIWVENTQVFNDQELALKLRVARQESSSPRSLLVIGDADSSHGTAVRVFDAGADAGVSGISLVVQEKGEGSR